MSDSQFIRQLKHSELLSQPWNIETLERIATKLDTFENIVNQYKEFEAEMKRASDNFRIQMGMSKDTTL